MTSRTNRRLVRLIAAIEQQQRPRRQWQQIGTAMLPVLLRVLEQAAAA
jgi:hypothetical protein